MLSERAAAPNHHAASIAGGLLGGAGVALLLSSRLGLTAWELVQTASQVLLFVLGSWLLPRDRSNAGPSWLLVSGVGVVFAVLRMVNYIRVAWFAPTPPPQYATCFDTSAFAYAIFGLYIAESMFMQVLLHRVLPAWTCTLIGVLQGLLWFIADLRYNAASQLSVWRVLRMVIMPQLGMFAPYHILTHKRIRCMLIRGSLPAPAPGAQQPKAVDSNKDSLVDSDPSDPSAMQAASLPEQETKPAGLQQQLGTGVLSGTEQRLGSVQVPSIRSPRPFCSTAGARRIEVSPAGAAASVAGAVRALSTAPYQSRLRATRKVCVKLDTRYPCEALPNDMAQQLQAALTASIGKATAVHISDVAMRPGCICVAVELEEQLAAASTGASDSQLHADELARVLLPTLQGMLHTGQRAVALPRAIVQLDNSIVTCVWDESVQAWDIRQRVDNRLIEEVLDSPWLGVAAVTSLQNTPAAASSSSGRLATPAPATGLLDVWAEVQLWGVSKVADVQGWTPPQQHQDSEVQWPDAQRAPGTLKLLARAAGGYLPTQVLRLNQGDSPNSVVAQVLVQLHEHQLIRHHDGGAPSSLLLMDMELWLNEVLLSSSPLLSVPAACAQEAVAVKTWWWGAADSTVAAALAEMTCCSEQLLLASSEEDASVSIHTFVQYTQDLATWLAQVQYTACNSHYCHAPAAGVQEGRQLGNALRPPTIPASALELLARELKQYASQMGWTAVKRMIGEQLQSIVAPAAAGRFQYGRGLSPLLAMYTVMLGYPCKHDEQLYKQQLAVHLSGVLMASSAATAVIGLTWVARALGWDTYTPFIFMSLSWSLLHAAAAVSMLVAHTCKQRPAQAAAVQFALCCTMVAYAWRIVIHVMMAVSREPGAMYMQTYQRTRVWVGMHMVLLLTEQVPASAVLPAKWVTCIGLMLEFPALICDLLRASNWAPVASVAAAFMAVVVAWMLVDAHLRRQLTKAPGAAAASRMRSKGAATSPPCSH